MKMAAVEAQEIIEALGLVAHPEGGHFRETWRDPDVGGRRGSGTAIYFLLAEGERSHWHRVDATEIWHFHAGAPLALQVVRGDETLTHVLGPNLLDGDEPQCVVPADAWQSARSLGDFTLVSCTVSPAFTFEGFELAPPGWEP